MRTLVSIFFIVTFFVVGGMFGFPLITLDFFFYAPIEFQFLTVFATMIFISLQLVDRHIYRVIDRTAAFIAGALVGHFLCIFIVGQIGYSIYYGKYGVYPTSFKLMSMETLIINSVASVLIVAVAMYVLKVIVRRIKKKRNDG